MKKLSGGVVSLVLLTVFCSCGYVPAQSQQQAIPSTFFGVHVNQPLLCASAQESAA